MANGTKGFASRRNRILGFCSLIALAAGAAGGAFAQGVETGQTSADQAKANSDEAIIVSARRREESLQKVPIAVSAFSGEQLSDINAQDLTAVGDLSPNITLKTSRSTNSTLTAFIRGVGQQDPVAGFEAGVGVYIDDVYLNRPQAALLDIFDVQRIEVLRGPQGTLYGRNTIGGAVKYVTKPLTDDPSLDVKLTGGTHGEFDGVGTFNLPIAKDSAIGDLKLGGSIAYLSHGGFGHNIYLGSGDLPNYNKKVLAGRLSTEWDPTNNFSLKITGDWTDDNSAPRQGHRLLAFTDAGRMISYPVLSNVYDTMSGLNTPKQSVVANGVSSVMQWKTSEHFTLKNILAYRSDRTNTPIDFDSLPYVDLDVPAIYDNNQLSEEFQILYEANRIHGIIGFYYLDAYALTKFDVLLGGTTLDPTAALNVFTSSAANTHTWSIFGDWTFDLSDMWSLSVGGRYTNDRRDATINRDIYLGGFSPTFGGPDRAPFLTQTDLSAEAEFHDFSPRASLTFTPNAENTFYFSYAQGFKSGGFDPRCVASTAPDINGDGVSGAAGDVADQRAFCLFQPENISTYEVGWKNSLFDGNFHSALDFFYSDYKDVQVPGSVGVDTNGDGQADTFAGVTTNAAKARIYGVEFEGAAHVAENVFGGGDSLDWQFSMGYINAAYTKYLGRGSPPPDITNVAVFQNTPKWNAYNRVTYSAPMGLMGKDGRTSLYGAVAYKSLTHQFGYAGPLDQPAYATVDAGVYWKNDTGRWKLGVYGSNLTDKRYKVAGYDFVTSLPAFGNSALGVTGVLTAFYGDPRQVLGTVEVAF
ncbi:MAG: TonB-dependent receptor [Alphaproteobacteria bacterium]|nr:TonB-dependent receptor [Alphaproteobacteria bacterium]